MRFYGEYKPLDSRQKENYSLQLIDWCRKINKLNYWKNIQLSFVNIVIQMIKPIYKLNTKYSHTNRFDVQNELIKEIHFSKAYVVYHIIRHNSTKFVG